MKKIMTVTALLLFGIWNSLLSQCPVGNINLFTQNDIHNFAINFPNCTELEGNLLIGKSGYPSDINDLSGLDALTHIGGSLTITSNPQLTNLNGLQNLNSIRENLSITGCPALVSLEGLSQLEEVSGSFSLSYLDNLNSLQGLENLENIGSDFTLYLVPMLTDFSGLNSLRTISGNMILEHNNGLISLEGIENLEGIGIDLVLRGNASLTSLEGLEGLSSIGGDLRIGAEYADGMIGNSSLTNLDGLAQLGSIGGDLHLIASDALTSLEGMAGLYFIGGNLIIRHNPLLSVCAIEPICEYLAEGGSASIDDNTGDCEDLDKVLGACQLTSTSDVSNTETFTLQPNPASGSVNIHFGNPNANIEWIRIYSMTGGEVSKATLGAGQIDLRGIPAGLYIVRVRMDGKDLVRRLSVQ